MARKWNLIVDVERCDNCRLCFLAVKDEYIGNDFAGVSAAQPPQGHNWFEIRRRERGSYPIVQARFLPVACNHCDEAPCIAAARDGAVRKRPDGIVIIDPERSKGQRQIAEACPYGAISWNEGSDIPQAWPFDAHLLDDGWKRTRAEQACPMGVFRTIKVEDDEMDRIRREETLAVLRPELGTRPRIYYKNLHLITKCFVSGTVVGTRDGIEECASDVEVILKRDGREVGRATTDSFGEFIIDGLEPQTSGYEIAGSSDDGSFRIAAEIRDESVYLGVIGLS
jgi:Fe-S-cluster-containing dehydrogenase component